MVVGSNPSAPAIVNLLNSLATFRMGDNGLLSPVFQMNLKTRGAFNTVLDYLGNRNFGIAAQMVDGRWSVKPLL